MLDTRPRFRRGLAVHPLDLWGCSVCRPARWQRVPLTCCRAVGWGRLALTIGGPAGWWCAGSCGFRRRARSRACVRRRGRGRCGRRGRGRARRLAADGDHAGGADAALNGDRFGAGPGWRAGGPRALELERLLVGERVGPDAEQFARVGVQEHQRRRARCGRSPGGRRGSRPRGLVCRPREMRPLLLTARSTSIAGPSLGWRERRRARRGARPRGRAG